MPTALPGNTVNEEFQSGEHENADYRSQRSPAKEILSTVQAARDYSQSSASRCGILRGATRSRHGGVMPVRHGSFFDAMGT